ncbi:MAG: hypothetical protein K9L79_09965 [Methylobacter tundripaludum]|nr:hypothetical protein [Methylobacter tundripaludum]
MRDIDRNGYVFVAHSNHSCDFIKLDNRIPARPFLDVLVTPLKIGGVKRKTPTAG